MSNHLHEFTHRDGTPRFAIHNEETNLYFIWCYTNKNFATLMLNRVHPGDELDRVINWCKKPDQLTTSHRNTL